MTIHRQQIIATLQERLGPNPQILAMWLEGADATETVDEYSDIDLCCSVKAGAFGEIVGQAREALESLAAVDLVQTLTAEEDQHHTVFHLAGTSESLLIDFVLHVGRGSNFAEGDEIEKPLVLFDRGPVMRTVCRAEYQASKGSNRRLQELKDTVAQSARIRKYVQRREFLEAYGYYQKWLLAPLIEALRMQYTPLHTDYYIVHISRHLPDATLRCLEELFKVNSVAEIESKSGLARAFFEETVARLQVQD